MDFEKRESFLLGKAAGLATARIIHGTGHFISRIEEEEQKIREELSDLYNAEKAVQKLLEKKPFTF